MIASLTRQTRPADHEVRGDNRKPVGIVQREMGDSDASLVDRHRLGDLAGVGDNGLARQAHVFPAAGGPEVERSAAARVDGVRRTARPPLETHSIDARRASGTSPPAADGATARIVSPKSLAPEHDFRPIGLDQALEPVPRERRIDQRGRVTGGGRRKQADHRFGIDAAEQKDQLLSLRGDFFGEGEARGAKLLAGQPDVAAIVADRRRRLERRDQRKQSAAGRIQIGHRVVWQPVRRIAAVRSDPPVEVNDEAAINPDDLPSHIR